MNTKSERTEFINEGFESHDWGISDRKGRALGSYVTYSTQVFEVAAADSKSWFYMTPGTYYAWVGQATRGGEPFGAIQRWHFCKTEKERFYAVQKYIKEACERAQRWAA